MDKILTNIWIVIPCAFLIALSYIFVGFIAYHDGQDAARKEVMQAFSVVEGDNVGNHPVAVCVREHFEKLNVHERMVFDE